MDEIGSVPPPPGLPQGSILFSGFMPLVSQARWVNTRLRWMSSWTRCGWPLSVLSSCYEPRTATWIMNIREIVDLMHWPLRNVVLEGFVVTMLISLRIWLPVSHVPSCIVTTNPSRTGLNPLSIPGSQYHWLLMTWWHKELGYQQPWHWPSFPRIFCQKNTLRPEQNGRHFAGDIFKMQNGKNRDQNGKNRDQNGKNRDQSKCKIFAIGLRFHPNLFRMIWLT